MSRQQLNGHITSLKKEIALTVDSKKLAGQPTSKGIPIDVEMDNLPVENDSFDRKEIEKLVSRTESIAKSIQAPFIMAEGDISLPLEYRPIVTAVQESVTALNKNREFVYRYLNNPQKNIRQEDASILTARLTHCDLTRAIFNGAQLTLSRESFLKVLLTVSRVFNMPYVVPEGIVSNLGYQFPSLFWESQREPFSHHSLISAHLFGWASMLQNQRVTRFEVLSVQPDFVKSANAG